MSEPSHTPVPISLAAAAVVGFLARYSSKNTASAFALDLRLLFQWCAAQGVDPLDATRTHLELFARYLEDERGNGPASVHRRLSTITCFYRMAEIDNYLDRSPATHLRLPRVYRDETTTLGLDHRARRHPRGRPRLHPVRCGPDHHAGSARAEGL